MRTVRAVMNIHRTTLIFVCGIIMASCSEKSAPDPEKATSEAASELVREHQAEPPAAGEAVQRPGEGKIGRDIVAFVRSTKIVPAAGASADCPRCPPGGTDVLTLRHFKTDSVSCSGATCTVVVTIHADFNPASGESMAGGLTAWISPEQRSAYLTGQIPVGEQVFRVQITYRGGAEGWRAVEFDRAPGG